MKKIFRSKAAVLGVSLALSFTLAVPVFAHMNTADGWLFETQLKGINEVPSVTPEKISGNGGVWFGPNGAYMNFWLFVFAGNEKITSAHLHCGSPGENGPVVVELFESTTATGVSIEGELARAYLDNADIVAANCLSVIGRNIGNIDELADAILDELIYINVHSINYPNGVARGQLTEYDFGNDDDDGDDEDDDDDGDDDGDDDDGDDD